jgi:hypothetical protein
MRTVVVKASLHHNGLNGMIEPVARLTDPSVYLDWVVVKVRYCGGVINYALRFALGSNPKFLKVILDRS